MKYHQVHYPASIAYPCVCIFLQSPQGSEGTLPPVFGEQASPEIQLHRRAHLHLFAGEVITSS